MSHSVRKSEIVSQLRAIVYTDGACSKNGRRGAKVDSSLSPTLCCGVNECSLQAGYGIYWGEGDSRNVSAPLTKGEQTNNRAEYTAG